MLNGSNGSSGAPRSHPEVPPLQLPLCLPRSSWDKRGVLEWSSASPENCPPPIQDSSVTEQLLEKGRGWDGTGASPSGAVFSLWRKLVLSPRTLFLQGERALGKLFPRNALSRHRFAVPQTPPVPACCPRDPKSEFSTCPSLTHPMVPGLTQRGRP